MNRIELKSQPFAKQVILKANSSYKRHNCYISEFHPMNINSYWDGGSRDYYTIVRLADLAVMPLPTKTHPFFEVANVGLANQSNPDITIDHVGNIQLERLPEGAGQRVSRIELFLSARVSGFSVCSL